jgi:hypothetical protein
MGQRYPRHPARPGLRHRGRPDHRRGASGLRWKAQGTYQGGFPGAPSEAVGREVTFTGTDTLRIADGKLAEYWANADSLLFFQQLGVREVPSRG